MLQNKQFNTKAFIIQYDDGGCVICISNKVEYLDKEFEWSDKILSKDVLFLGSCFSMQ